ncbi:DUF1565 domain-containing protein [Bremerella cremea]|uniref:DUF1565 domain-containing protein n=1 Tax=Bremerella cremea TaxID=1031537 RepID=A0A368KUQ1_9BACT|nr:right-handed parallel beta-helix repeat-containing protein [Bremerella cremea]RCS51939.1 DUF1565 domain-containing protein [Bremerella cremea]
MRYSILAVLFILVAEQAFAATYHVAVDGSDNATGASNQPWQTLQHAIESVKGGDIILLHEGDHAGFSIRSGKIDNLFNDWVTIRSLNGHKATVGYTDIYLPASILDNGDSVTNAFIQFDDLIFRDRIRSYGAKRVKILNSKIFQEGPKNDNPQNIVKRGIEVTGADCLIENCEVTDCAIGIQVRGWRNVVKNCHIHDVFHDGLRVVDSCDTVIDGCLIYHCDDGYSDGDINSPVGIVHADCLHVFISGSVHKTTNAVKNVTIRNCRMYGTEGAAIQVNNRREQIVDGLLLENNVIGMTNGGAINISEIHNCTIRHNTFRYFKGGYAWGRFDGVRKPANSNCTLICRPPGKNCVCYNNLFCRSTIETDTIGWSSHNNFFDSRNYAHWLKWQDGTSKAGNPKFTTNSWVDPELRPDSPAINFGVPAKLPLSINGVIRDITPDCGAWEIAK